MYKYIDDIIEFNSILDNKSSNILSMEDFNDLQIKRTPYFEVSLRTWLAPLLLLLPCSMVGKV